MATLDVTAAISVLKEYYSNQRVTNMMYKDAPLWALLPKIKDFYGKTYPLPNCVSSTQGRSGTFANAQAQKTAPVYKDFSLTRARDYSLASIDSEAWMASEVNPGAFVKLATDNIDKALASLKRAMAWAAYGDGVGTIGTAASVTSANPAVVTLENVEDISKFEVGMTVESRDDTTPATTRVWATTTPSAVITKVNRDLGTFTLGAVDNSGNTDTVTAGDLIMVVGDYDVKMSGLAAWIPASAPAATAFFGVDRTVDTTRLGGVRVASSGKPLDEAYIDAARRIGREGAAPDYGFCGFSRYASLEKTLGSRVIYDDVEVAGVGFRGIKISGPTKPITILPDRDCPENKSYLLTMDTWAYYSLKEPVQILDLDGNKALREGSADAYEIRCATYGQLGCEFPGANAVMNFT